ncbi:MAG TPA: glycerol-3-phosphate 1-O-acyltransferase PlsY [Lacibacter sp.]|nr:glycerol-3-phosphate 1-O-acyltransferase PlsY [Lacibacter sp.]HMO90311.1 glycerol-3-phosphate 1-O-acyltransferase PlsY [Lacibacter sp.]HMP87023.1 glycerol-3-phosphate 1-O-acyltransferase PlsY [Lacibacter sp.]
MTGGWLLLLAYLLGSIPTALWVSKLFFGIDIRDHGSRNMGASNTFRVLGPVYGVVVLVIDLLKGVAAVQLVRYLPETAWMASEPALWQLLLGLTAVAGHVFPLFAGFRGGKGVATLFGVVVAMQPWIALLSVLAFVLVVALTRYISLGSLTGVAVFTACVWFAWQEADPLLKWFSAGAALLVVWLHRGNIRRLWKGTENKFSFRKRPRD